MISKTVLEITNEQNQGSMKALFFYSQINLFIPTTHFPFSLKDNLSFNLFSSRAKSSFGRDDTA